MSDNDKSLDILGIKPVADSVNRITRAAVDGASAFLSRICLPAAEELGLLFRDKVANWRARNAVVVVEHAREKLNDSGVDIDKLSAHPRIVGQILDAGSWSEVDEIQDLWGGLLASSCTEDGRDESNLIFANLLAQLTSLQARVITHGCETAIKVVTQGGWIIAEDLLVNLEELKRLTGVDDIHRLDRELDHLRALELIDRGFDQDTQVADITPTSLCLQLYMRCKGHRGDPVAFYGLQESSSKDEATIEPETMKESTTTSKRPETTKGRKAAKTASRKSKK